MGSTRGVFLSSLGVCRAEAKKMSTHNTVLPPSSAPKPIAIPILPKWRGFVQGACAAMVGASATHPLDLMKVRMQLGGSGTTNGLVSATVNVVKTEGATALYAGL